jgi:hypothetical protein
MVPDQERCEVSAEFRRRFAEIVARLDEPDPRLDEPDPRLDEPDPQPPPARRRWGAARWLRPGLAGFLVVAGVAVALLAMLNVSVIAGAAGLAGVGAGLFFGVVGESGTGAVSSEGSADSS